MQSANSIEKKVTLNASISRVWRALTDTQEFGEWFGVELDGPFVEGRAISGRFSGTFDEQAIADYQRSLGLVPGKVKIPQKLHTFCSVVRMTPEHYFSFRWIPFGVDADVDPQNEPTTLVEFRLHAVADGTELTIAESGFEQVPASRRQRAFLMNDGGWAAQAQNVKRYVEAV